MKLLVMTGAECKVCTGSIVEKISTVRKEEIGHKTSYEFCCNECGIVYKPTVKNKLSHIDYALVRFILEHLLYMEEKEFKRTIERRQSFGGYGWRFTIQQLNSKEIRAKDDSLLFPDTAIFSDKVLVNEKMKFGTGFSDIKNDHLINPIVSDTDWQIAFLFANTSDGLLLRGPIAVAKTDLKSLKENTEKTAP